MTHESVQLPKKPVLLLQRSMAATLLAGVLVAVGSVALRETQPDSARTMTWLGMMMLAPGIAEVRREYRRRVGIWAHETRQMVARAGGDDAPFASSEPRPAPPLWQRLAFWITAVASALAGLFFGLVIVLCWLPPSGSSVPLTLFFSAVIGIGPLVLWRFGRGVWTDWRAHPPPRNWRPSGLERAMRYLMSAICVVLSILMIIVFFASLLLSDDSIGVRLALIASSVVVWIVSALMS